MKPPAAVEHRPPRPSNIYRSGIAAHVKWFNPDKGFGFVTPDDGSADAFLHASAVRDAGHEQLVPGQALVCDIAPGQKGPQVALIHSVSPPPAEPRGRGDRSRHSRGEQSPSRSGRAEAAAGRPAAPRPAGRADPGLQGRPREDQGTVKFFSAEKGFGFITPDRGTKDIFVHESVLRRSGLEALQPRVRVRVRYRETERGLEADSVEFL